MIIVILIIVGALIFFMSSLNHKEKVSQISGELRVKYPNFVRALRLAYGDDMLLKYDNNSALCYTTKIQTYGRHMGNMSISLVDKSSIGNSTYLIQLYKGFDGIEITTDRCYLPTPKDLEMTEYAQIFKQLAMELLADGRYSSSVSILNK
jgi:hypothetical protein